MWKRCLPKERIMVRNLRRREVLKAAAVVGVGGLQEGALEGGFGVRLQKDHPRLRRRKTTMSPWNSGSFGILLCLATSGLLIVQSKIGPMEIQVRPSDVRRGGRDRRGRRPWAGPASHRREGPGRGHAAAPFAPGRPVSASFAPGGGECVFDHETRAQQRKACASIESVVW